MQAAHPFAVHQLVKRAIGIFIHHAISGRERGNARDECQALTPELLEQFVELLHLRYPAILNFEQPSKYYSGLEAFDISNMAFAWKASGLTYNRYLAIAARVVRRSLKEGPRLQAERRGEMGLRFAKWEGGKQGDITSLASANETAMQKAAGKEQ